MLKNSCKQINKKNKVKIFKYHRKTLLNVLKRRFSSYHPVSPWIFFSLSSRSGCNGSPVGSLQSFKMHTSATLTAIWWRRLLVRQVQLRGKPPASQLVSFVILRRSSLLEEHHFPFFGRPSVLGLWSTGEQPDNSTAKIKLFVMRKIIHFSIPMIN